MFVRQDWTLFRNLSTLSQKAGVPVSKLRMLVLKELADNALDVCGDVKVERSETWYVVEDSGPGIDGGRQEIESLFSVGRPLTSSKILRLPSRGALGNGLRVVVGSVLASGGQLKVATRGFEYELQPLDDGRTRALSVTDSPVQGTRVSIRFGDSLPSNGADLLWANLAKIFRFAQTYKGLSSPWWYDSDSFFELLLAAESYPTASLVKQVRDGDKVENRVSLTLPLQCNRFTREKADELLSLLREHSPRVLPAKIGKVGAEKGEPYHKVEGVLTVKPGRGTLSAELPFVVEAWATAARDGDGDSIQAYVNGTPITGELRCERQKGNKLAVFGCGLRNYLEGVSRKSCSILFNVTIPYMPVTTDGKEPDFSRLLNEISSATSKATKKLKSNIRKVGGFSSQKDVILRNLSQAVRKASGNHEFRYSIRQLFYAVRPFILEGSENAELDYGYFSSVIGQYENDMGELDGLYRDPRGTLYHPHLRRSIPIGTLAVEEYSRPAWTFNKILYLEKEGLVHLLLSVGWPERHDCALLSSKGFASRAVRDLLDLLGDTDEEIHFYCVHDADASGGLIYQALQDGTTAREARRVKIHNLGLEPWEALDMDLQVENFTIKGGRALPVANYVKDFNGEGPPGARTWEKWLQGRRVELNAMTSPQFIEWLDSKMVEHGATKLVPPTTVLKQTLTEQTESALRRRLAERILAEQGLDELVRQGMEERSKDINVLDIERAVRDGLEDEPKERWSGPVNKLAEEIAG